MTGPQRIGDGPIEMTFEQAMNSIAAATDRILNGLDAIAGKIPRKTGFVLLVFPFDSDDGRCNYISNGANRKDIVKMFKEQIRHFEEDFTPHE